MSSLIHWPHNLFQTQDIPAFHSRPFTRRGGRTLSGFELTTQTDLGFWQASLSNILVMSRDLLHQEAWNAIRVALQGRSGLVIVPAYHVGSRLQKLAKAQRSFVAHSDGSKFSDGASYRNEPALLQMEEQAQIGSTVVKLRGLQEGLSLSGIRFSYFHALYESGPVIEKNGDVVQLPIFPAVRAKIPAGALLNVSEPTCLMHLASDNQMDMEFGLSPVTNKSLSFVEAIDYWDEEAAS